MKSLVLGHKAQVGVQTQHQKQPLRDQKYAYKNKPKPLINSLLSDIGQGIGSGFLYTGIELLQTDHQGFKGSRINNSMGECGGVLGYCS